MHEPTSAGREARHAPATSSSADSVSDRFTVERILVATAGKAPANPAIDAARVLARRHGAVTEVVSVFQPPIPYPSAPGDLESPPIAESDRLAAQAQIERVRRQLEQAGPGCSGWPVHVEAGHAAWRITCAATRSGSDLIVVGLGRQSPADRPRGDRTVMGVAIRARIPVLAAAVGFSGTPRHMLLAVGRDPAIVRAARVAGTLFPPPERAALVHVAASDEEAARAGSDPALTRQMEAVRRALGIPANRHVETRVLTGIPARAILEFAREEGTDLIVAGLHGDTADQRVHIRNTALHVLSRAECSVLIVPTEAHRAD